LCVRKKYITGLLTETIMKCLLKYALAFLSLNCPYSLYAQAPDTLWTKTIGGVDWEWGRSVQQTINGGYIVTGCTYSFGNGEGDIYLLYIDATGKMQWSKTFGGADNDEGYSVQQTSDGGFIIAGKTYSYGAGSSDIILLKTDANGDSIWARTFGGTDMDEAYSVQQTMDGGYILTGITISDSTGLSDILLLKTNPNGDSLWAKTFGGNQLDIGESVQQTADSGYIIVGYTLSYGAGGDVYIIKTDINGDTIWTKIYGDVFTNYGRSVQQTTDSGYIITGYTDPYWGTTYAFLIKTDVNGDTIWTKNYHNGMGIGSFVQQTTDGGYIIAGYNWRYGFNSYDVFLIKTNAIGDTIWTKTIGGAADDGSYSIQQTNDEGYIVTGWTKSYGAGKHDVYLIKLKPESNGIEEVTNNNFVLISNPEPNPFFNRTTIRYTLQKQTDLKIDIYNLTGQKIKELFSGRQYPGSYQICWDGTGNRGEKLSSGIYFLVIKEFNSQTNRKLLLLR